MIKVTKENIISIGRTLMVEFTEKQLVKIENHFLIVVEQMNIIKGIDTTGVKPLDFCFELPHTNLREDIVDHTSQKEYIIENAVNKTEDYVKINKVISNE